MQASTIEISKLSYNGSVEVEIDGQWYVLQGMTEQANGDILVHLDDNGHRVDIQVAFEDRNEPYWCV